ncbi:alpha/beta hydrolase [Sedimentisphaera salicampi]|uniref:Acetylxylan esterase n=1 Tax=Sedimentisphaera salicampi TaxID=1941349 RepID=A0A1W6LJW4_9BACT|nr:alpha/beta hydrolase [Sedimentisphaera salicampi]ARN56045.1 Acetylxylan esterase precursor [Sedimentisphaera salicampi]
MKYLVMSLLIAGSLFSAEIKPDKIMVYKHTEQTDLTMHIFNPEEHKSGDKTPCIVFFFGGGWVSGSPSHFYQQAEYLSSRGMTAMCADYRTKNKYETSPKECVRDGKSAIRWVRANADALGVDPNMIAAGGGSAGGHVASATAALDGFNEKTDNLEVSCRPNALVLFNPVFDNGPNGYGYERVKDYWRGFSPLHNIHKDMPQATVFLGTKDDLIPVSTAETFKTKMNKLGNRCDLHTYKGCEHGFFNKKKFYVTLLEADKFLTSLGYLEGKPTLKK